MSGSPKSIPPIAQAAMKAAFALDLPNLNDLVWDTACAFVNFEQQFRHDGLAFASVDHLVFVPDEPMVSWYDEQRSLLVFALKECAADLDTRWYRPNAVLDIGVPLDLVGPKGRMRRLTELIETSWC